RGGRSGREQMAVPFNDTRRRFARNREQVLAHWGELLDSGIYIGGSAVRAFERAFAEATGTAECVAVANGTDAIELALRGVGVTAGDEVITVANAGGYTSTACQAIGAMPVYVDVDPTTCQLDSSALRPALSPSTKVVVVTHLYGLMSDVAAIRSRLDEAGRRDVLILEDCAQAHGAQRDGRRAGSMGDVGTFSFYPTKNLGAV